MDTTEKIDTSQFLNLVDVRDDLKRQEFDIEERLQHRKQQKKAAVELLAMPDLANLTIVERREAEASLEQVERMIAKLKAGLERVQLLIKLKEGQLALMRPTFEAEEKRRRAVAALRARL